MVADLLPKNDRSARGFTLIETIIVLAIVRNIAVVADAQLNNNGTIGSVSRGVGAAMIVLSARKGAPDTVFTAPYPP